MLSAIIHSPRSNTATAGAQPHQVILEFLIIKHLIVFLEESRSRHDSPPVDAVSRPAKHLCPPSSIFLFSFFNSTECCGCFWRPIDPGFRPQVDLHARGCPQMPTRRVGTNHFPYLCQRQPERAILAEDAIIDLSMRRTAASLALPGQHPTETSTSTDSPTQVVCGSHNVFVRSTENVDCCCLCGATAIDGNDS